MRNRSRPTGRQGGRRRDEPETVLVNEICLSKEHHDRCLDLPEVRDAISAGMPLVAELRSQESTVVGGLGVAG